MGDSSLPASLSNPNVVEHTIGTLSLDTVYAVQLNYLVNTGGQEEWVFAARDHYVYPSGTPVGNGDRVASFPLTQRTSNKVWRYVFCTDTFSKIPSEQMQYAGYVEHAFDQWERATDHLVTIEPVPLCEGGTPTCANYGDLVEQIQDDVVTFVTMNGLESLDMDLALITSKAQSLALNLDRAGLRTKWKRDADLSEVRAIERVDVANTTSLTERQFLQMSSALSHGFCPARAYGCASNDRSSTGEFATDILIVRGHYPLTNTIPDLTKIRMSSCGEIPDSKFYSALIHEAGHALGIRGGGDGIGQQLGPSEPKHDGRVHELFRGV